MALTQDDQLSLMFGLEDQIRGRFFDQCQRMRPRVDIDDLVQQVYMEAFQSFDQCRATEPTQFKGWVMMIARNKANRFWYRHRKVDDLGKQEFAIGVGAGDEGTGWLPEDVRQGTDPVANAELREEASTVLEMVEAMANSDSQHMRTTAVAIKLRYLDGLMWKHVGEKLGIPMETARTMATRGLAAIRSELDLERDGAAELCDKVFSRDARAVELKSEADFHQDALMLRVAIRRVPNRFRAVLTDRYLKSLSWTEVAERSGIDVAQAKSLIQRSIVWLKLEMHRVAAELAFAAA